MCNVLREAVMARARSSEASRRPRRGTGQTGFTLVELAVVQLIIGLIIGGILRGQELIESAKTNAIQVDANRIRTAYNTFRDKFVASPGDFEEASTFIDSDFTLKNGDGDDRIEGDRIRDNDAEANQFWAHLSAVGMLTRVDGAEIADDGVTPENAMRSDLGGVLFGWSGLGQNQQRQQLRSQQKYQ